MKLERWGLQNQRAAIIWIMRRERHRDLMHDRGRNQCDGVCHSGNDGTVVMAADDALDLGMAGDHRGKRTSVVQVDGVLDHAAGERRVVHPDDGRLVRCGGKCAIEEFQLRSESVV